MGNNITKEGQPTLSEIHPFTNQLNKKLANYIKVQELEEVSLFEDISRAYRRLKTHQWININQLLSTTPQWCNLINSIHLVITYNNEYIVKLYWAAYEQVDNNLLMINS